MAKLWKEASAISDAQGKCERCGKKAEWYYFVEGSMVTQTCKKHQIEPNN